jgi:hypothetical protein
MSGRVPDADVTELPRLSPDVTGNPCTAMVSGSQFGVLLLLICQNLQVLLWNCVFCVSSFSREYLLKFFLWPIENLSPVLRFRYCQRRAAKFRPVLDTYGICAGMNFFSYHNCCDLGPWFLWSHSKLRVSIILVHYNSLEKI